MIIQRPNTDRAFPVRIPFGGRSPVALEIATLPVLAQLTPTASMPPFELT